MRTGLAAILAGLMAVGAVSAQRPLDHFEYAQTPRLAECAHRPAFRVVVNAMSGTSVSSIPLEGTNPVDAFRIIQDGVEITPFHLETGSADAQQSYLLLLLDTSGSMAARLGSQTRFEAAREAARRASQTLGGSDYVAIVPFDSRRVAARIRSAEFASTPSGVEQQLAAIPTPLKDSNTALYSSMLEALPLLADKARTGAAVSLLVLTDGDNDVGRPGDDEGLLGAEGLSIVRQRIRELGIPVTTVGFGLASQSGHRALEALAYPSSSNYYDAATDPQRLQEIFEAARRKLTNRIQLTFFPLQTSRESLAGRTLQFKVRYLGNNVTSVNEPSWNAPAVAAPVYDLTCSVAEEAAALTVVTDDSNRLSPSVKRLAILLGLSGLLATFWFGAPRLMWPDRYVPKPVLPNLDAVAPGLRSAAGPLPPMPSRPSAPQVPQGPRPDASVRLPPRSAPRPASPRRDTPEPSDTVSRSSTEETVYRPPNRRTREE